jgi:hypothetical protein
MAFEARLFLCTVVRPWIPHCPVAASPKRLLLANVITTNVPVRTIDYMTGGNIVGERRAGEGSVTARLIFVASV